MTVYLIHFDQPISPDHTTQHYIGFTNKPLRERLSAHRDGRGARLLQVAKERGIGWSLVRTWPSAGRDVERALKRNKFGNRVCPLCGSTARGLAVQDWKRKRFVRPRTVFVVPTTNLQGEPSAV